MKKSELSELLRRRLGYPLIKVELTADQIEDAIDQSRQLFIKWATGNATTDRYYTMLLYAGISMYDLPGTVLDVLDYTIGGSGGGVHQLFSLTNYMYSNGMMDAMFMRGGADGYSLISYYIARDFMDTMQRYMVSSYDYIYHRYSNQLEITPCPPSGNSMTFQLSGSNVAVDSPGFLLLRVLQVEGTVENLYDQIWVQEYSLALCKVTLGRIRSKFANFTAIGSNVGLSLDGETLLQEGQAELEKLNTTLRNEETYEGYEILIG